MSAGDPAGAPRAALRALLAGQSVVFPASVFDPLSLQLAAEAGFEMAMLAGSIAALVLLGAPDLVLIEAGELAALAQRIASAAPLPLFVDGDHGYGNALNVMRTTERLEAAGVAGFSIEDTELPAPPGAAAPRFLSREAASDKIRAACAARRDPALVIAGRSGVLPVLGIEEAIARGAAFREAGADLLFFTGVKPRAEVEALAAALPPPLMLGGLVPELDDPAFLARSGVRVALRGHAPYLAALAAARRTYHALREGGALPERLSADELALLSEEPLWRERARHFLARP